MIEKKILIQNDKKKVWRALWEPSETKKWWGDGIILVPKEGGVFREAWTDSHGGQQMATGRVLASQEEEHIEFSWRERSWEHSTVCRIELSPAGEATELLLTHSGWEEFSRPQEMIKAFDGGWEFLLGKLKKHLENTSEHQGLID